MPKTKLEKWAMWLGLLPFFSGPILGISAALVVPLISRTTSEKVASTIGFSLGIGLIVLTITAFVLNILVYRTGNRSLSMWIGLIPSILALLFWIFMIVGEFAFPH
jgi:uncharacterized membrane protein